MKLARRPLSVLLVAVLGLGACSSVRTESDTSVDVFALGTYAWTTKEPIKPLGTEVRDPELIVRIRRAVDERLAAAGMRKVAVDDARVLVAASAGVQSKVQNNDPYYSLYVAEQYEVGTLTLDMYEAATGKLARHGEVWHRLRYVSRAMGGVHVRFTPTAEEREWPVDEMLDKIFAELR